YVKRLGILLVAPHGPRPDQRRFRFAILDHLDRPAVIVLVLDDARGPAVVAPQSVFVNGLLFGVVRMREVGHEKKRDETAGSIVTSHGVDQLPSAIGMKRCTMRPSCSIFSKKTLAGRVQ